MWFLVNVNMNFNRNVPTIIPKISNVLDLKLDTQKTRFLADPFGTSFIDFTLLFFRNVNDSL